MFEFDNTHIFTGYLKQLLSSFNLPMCKIYTNSFANYAVNTGKEDPRIVESFDSLNADRLSSRINYLKDNEIYCFFRDSLTQKASWKKQTNLFYDPEKSTPGLTKVLVSPGAYYDSKTHEYLGDFLRFLRDYYDINLMPLYNCFSNKDYKNISFTKTIKSTQNITTFNENSSAVEEVEEEIAIFDSNNAKYKIYAIPVKLFENYTIAIDCNQGIELFCGLYKSSLDTSEKAKNLFDKTYLKVGKTLFNQPFLYDKLDSDNWLHQTEMLVDENGKTALENSSIISRCDILNREQDLKLFIKVPITCTSSITILEGDYRTYNDYKYCPGNENSLDRKYEIWNYRANSTVINFENKNELNSSNFKPISKLQLLAFNTGKSYPFADRLVEYLSGSATLPIDMIPDNIIRAQKVMNKNNHYFKITGLWENKMQKIAYNYMINEGPFQILNIPENKPEDTTDYYEIKLEERVSPEAVSESEELEAYYKRSINVKKGKKSKNILVDRQQGKHIKLGYTSKSTLYDILGYIDRDVEKCYANWKIEKDNDNNAKVKVSESIQNVDIYDGLYDI